MLDNSNAFLNSVELKNTTKVYFDHNATTPLHSEILQLIPKVLQYWGNPSSIHWAGRGPKTLIREARQNIAKVLNINPLEIIFTSGGSEANTAIVNSFLNRLSENRSEFITSQVEHPSLLKAFQNLEKKGYKVHYLKVSRNGEIDLKDYQSKLSEKTALVSIMYANNETGTVFPIQDMVKLAHESGALFHSDCVQALGKVNLNLQKLDVDYASFSAHKVYALKGCGFLYVKKNCPYSPLIFGGGQERGRRGGTENTLAIWTLGYMASLFTDLADKYTHMLGLRNYLEQEILASISGVKITAIESPRLPNTSSLILSDIDGETLLMSLDLKNFAVSTGAACSSGNPEPSPVLLAMGLSKKEAQSSLRVSIGWSTSKEEVDQFIKILKDCVDRLRKINLQQSEIRDAHV